MLFGFNIWQIVFATVAFPVLAGIGSVQFRNFEQRDFQPQTIKQQTIDQRQLSAARDLKGTWKGTARYDLTDAASRCSDFITWGLVINITAQTGNTIGGNITYTPVSQEGTGDINCDPAQGSSYDITGTISSSSITINENGSSAFTGSFTSDTITLNQSGGGSQLTAPINLRGQK